MATKLIARNGFAADYVPLKAFDHRLQVSLEHRSETKYVRNPTQRHGPALQYMWVDCNLQNTASVINRNDSPGHVGLATALASYLEIVTGPILPMQEMALVYPAA